MVSYAQKPEQIFYARWDIRAFRSVERFEDYKRVKASLIRAPDTAADSNAPRGWKRRWRSFSSDRGLTKTIAYGTIAIVFLTCALLASIRPRLPDAPTMTCGNAQSGAHLIGARLCVKFPQVRGPTWQAPTPGMSN